MGVVPRSRVALASLVGLVAMAVGVDARAYVVKKTTRGELVHWERSSVGYSVDPSVERAVRQGGAAARHAIESWSGTVGAPDLSILRRDETAPTKPGFDEKNGVFFVKDGYAPAGRALAITVLTYDNASGRILDADVIVNGKYTFEVLPDPANLPERAVTAAHTTTTDGVSHEATDQAIERGESIYDLHHVLAHELGHSLGMNDEMGRTDALMYRYSAPNDASMREPGSDDIAGLAELYSQKLEARGNGCGSATVAPKKPSSSASQIALWTTIGFLAFLVLRARTDRRARVAVVALAAISTIAFVPSLSGRDAAKNAQASEPLSARALGHARARVVDAATHIEDGLFKTSYRIATTSCHTNSCPRSGHGETWGGTANGITQEVGGLYAPSPGDEVDVSFRALPQPLAALKPLAGRTSATDLDVGVLTKAR